MIGKHLVKYTTQWDIQDKKNATATKTDFLTNLSAALTSTVCTFSQIISQM
jgi:hypothetical protein